MAFEQHTTEGVRFYTSHALDGVTHAFSTRVGGVSRPPFDSLNLGSSEHDEKKDILQNYTLFTSAVGVDADSLVFTKQVHGDVVRVVEPWHRGNGFTRPSEWECDALITNHAGLALTIFWADCVPVLLYDPVAKAIGAAHAGWRGVASGVVLKTAAAMVERYGCRNIHAAIGPSIGACCFETRDDVAGALRSVFGELPKYIVPAEPGRYNIDLKGINAWLLRRAGITEIDISPLCTCCLDDEFFSHRRSGATRGTQAAIITLGDAI